jgi:hypothetical protein
MVESRKGGCPDDQSRNAPEAYFDMSPEERQRLIAQLHARRSREISQAISRLALTLCRFVGQMLQRARRQ